MTLLRIEPRTPCKTKEKLKGLMGYIFQKLLFAWKFSWINKNCFFCQGNWYLWPHCCMNNLYISHRTLYAPTYSFWTIGSMLISLLELLPGLIPLTMLWHAGWTLAKTICMNMTYNYSTTIFRSILTQILCNSGIIYNFSIWPWKIHKQKLKIYIFLPEICTFWAKILLNIVVE